MIDHLTREAPLNAEKATLLLLGILLSACAGSPGIESAGGGGAGGAGSVGSGAGGLAPQRPGSGAAGQNAAGGSGGNGAACSSTSAKAVALPVDILILQDKSGSMKDPAMTGGMLSKWEATKQAIGLFLQSPAAAGINVGLNFFPQGNGDRGSCNPTQYATPAVGIAPLPGVGAQVTGALNATSPMGGTPTLPALLGAVQYAHAWEMMKNRRVAIALATDGEPNDCNSSVAAVSGAAAMAAATGIYTFVLGVGPNLQNLNAIAQAGNTKMAYFADTGSVDQLIAAFKSIQLQAAKLACSFAIPPPPMGGMLDPSRVNVRFTPGGSAAPMDLGQVSGRGQCGPTGGWYYDNPGTPSSVTLCDASCQLVNTSPDGELSLLFGCMTNLIK
jgi:hypothetical protein